MMAPPPRRPVQAADVDALHRYAACRNADPHLFDATNMLTAAEGLAYCARCQVIRLCNTVLAPSRTEYDGIAAAAVWRSGRRIGTLTRSPIA